MAKLLTNRWIHFLFLFLLLFVLVFVIHPKNPVRERIQLIVFDNYLINYPRSSNSQVAVIDIDDESLEILGQWPWPRDLFAKIIDYLDDLEAKVVAFDGVLAEPDRTSPSRFFERLPEEDRETLIREYDAFKIDNDEVLAQSIYNYGRFISGFTHGIDSKPPRIVADFKVKKSLRNHFLKYSFPFVTTAKFIPVLESKVAGNGSFMALPEIDNVIRRTPIVFTNREKLFPSLNLEAIRVSFESPPNPIIDFNENYSSTNFQSDVEVKIGSYKIPIDEEGKIWIHFKSGEAVEKYIPAYKVFDVAHHEEIGDLIKDKVVFIASSAEGLKDLRSTPLGLLPGVEIHVNAVEQILDGSYITRPLTILEAENYFILIFGILLILLVPFINAVSLLFVSVLGVGSAIGISHYAFVNAGLLIDPAYPSLSIVVIFVVASLLNYIRTEAERKQVREAFGLYISPHFMEELTKDPDKLKLGGEVRDLTVMFSDIRSFTTISEALTPEELIQLMNDFLTPMSDLVMSNRGTIDKYMGDAMMAFWNAPLDDENHARNACRAALKMDEALVPINEGVKAKAEADGREAVLLRAGIGINTGPCSVGNMGSKQRFAYSALGDAVNLASRLEGQTKTYGVNILCGEETWRLVPEYAWLELDLIRVKGKTEPVRVFALMGDEEMAQSDSFKHWQSCHNGLIAAYRAADFDCAAQDLAASVKASGGQLEVFYDLYSARIKEMVTNPPANDWDGVFVATSK